MGFSQIHEEISSRCSFVCDPILDLRIGPIYGIHPNLRNEKPEGYYFVEGNSSLTFIGLPFNLTFRKSNENLRYGRASYFKMSFDVQKFKSLSAAKLEKQLTELDSNIQSKNANLYLLKSKISYLFQKKTEIEAKLNLAKPTINKPSVPLDSLSSANLPLDTLSQLNSIDIPDSIPSFTNLNSTKLDSIQSSIQNYLNSISSIENNLTELKSKKQKLQGIYAQILKKESTSFLSGFQKLDVGLTTLSKSSMSKNSIPIQGMHVQYSWDNYFADVAAGYSLPNQLFSNQAFDQLIYNSGNIFNQGDFFQVKNTQFISSAKVGYGKETGNHVAIENFYTGPFLSFLDHKHTLTPTYTSNLIGRYSPSKLKNLTFTNSLGYTWYKPVDSLSNSNQSISNSIALFSSACYSITKTNSFVEVSFRRIPSGYDGATQGIYLNQTDRIELLYKQQFSRNFKSSFRLVRDNFYINSATISSRQIDQATIDLQYRFSKHLVSNSSYSLLSMKDRDVKINSNTSFSHLGRIGINSMHELFHHSFTTYHDLSYAKINGFDSLQTLTQYNSKVSLELEKVKFSCSLQYSNFKGLTRIYGENWIVQPEMGFKIKDFTLFVSYQKLWSEQFKSQEGFSFKTHFSFFENLDFDLTMQRFLPTEYVLFINDTSIGKPFYLKFSSNIHLK